MNNRQKTMWQCMYMHKWDMSVNHVRNRYWCPLCLTSMVEKMFALGFICLMLVGIAGCSKDEEKPVKINFEKREISKEKATLPEKKFLRIAVGSMITPKEGFAYYQQLLNYIEERLGRPVKFVDRESYVEVNNLLKSGDIDVAFVCGRPYVDGHDEFGMELLVAPQAYGEVEYYSYIIVSKDSSIKSFEDLRGKSFAFCDPLSNSGKAFPMYLLAKIGETPDSYFEKYYHTYAHDKSIKAVAQGIVDGAAVDHLIWEYLNRMNPADTLKTRVIVKSPPFGIPPVVVRPGLAPEIKEKLRHIFLNAHMDEEGGKILEGMMIEKFVPITDKAYESIREMRSWIAGGKPEKAQSK